MKNSQKIAIAEQVVVHARSLGFVDAQLTFSDDEGYTHDTLEELANENAISLDEPASAVISIILDEDLAFSLTGDPGDEDAEPQIEFAK